MSSTVLLSDNFIYTLNNVDCKSSVTLTGEGVTISEGNGRFSHRLKYIHLTDVIGAKVHYGAKDSVYLLLHYFPLVKNRFNGKVQRCKKQIVLCSYQHQTTSGNVKQCMGWKRAITRTIYGSDESGERAKSRIYLVFVNPMGGKGMAEKIWLSSVKPILDMAGIKTDVVYTEYSGHAGDYVRVCTDIFKYSSIVTISGDGIIFEVFNGMMKREDCAEAIKIPLAIIPGGSGNGLCAAILHQSGVPLTLMDAIYVAVRGVSSPLDLVKVEQENTTVWSFLSIAWGFWSAVDMESQANRWMGEARFTVEAVKKLLSFPIKSGKVWFASLEEGELDFPTPTVVSPNAPRRKQISRQSVRSTAPVSIEEHLEEPVNGEAVSEADTDIAELDPDIDFTALNDVDEDSDGESQDLTERIPDRTRTVSETVLETEESEKCRCKKCEPPSVINEDRVLEIIKEVEKVGLKDEIPDSWTLIEGNFASVMAFTLTHLSMGYRCAEKLQLDAGFVYLMHSFGGSKKDFWQLLLQNCTPESNETSTINFEKVRAFRLEPEISESGAYVTIDGELVPYEALHACIHKGIARVRCLPTSPD